MSLDIMKRVKERRQEDIEGKTRIVEVPEFGTEDEPAKLHIWPPTSEEFEKILKASHNRIEEAAMTLVIRARDENGKNLFQPAELKELKREVPPDVLIRLSYEINGEMLADIKRVTPEEVGK